MFLKKDKSAAVSLPKEKIVHGVTIRKVPTGKYVEVMKTMEELPATLAEICFPGKSGDEILSILTSIDKDTVNAVAIRLLAHAPEKLIAIICDIVGMEYDVAMNTLTPKELMDVLKAFWEMNDLTDFFKNVWGQIKKLLPTLNIGSKNG